MIASYIKAAIFDRWNLPFEGYTLLMIVLGEINWPMLGGVILFAIGIYKHYQDIQRKKAEIRKAEAEAKLAEAKLAGGLVEDNLNTDQLN